MDSPANVDYRSFRHWGGFFFSGGTAFIVDASVTTGLHDLVGLDPFSSRLFGIACGLVVAWLLHRQLTFAVSTPPTFREFGRFASVAMSANIVNYGIYALILLVRPETLPLVALVMSTAIAMVVSYLGFRLRVFRRPNPDPSSTD
jgi:putative flippase GtrA